MGIEVAILVSSYQRPWHLARVLASIRHQRGVGGRMEVVVTDDGSTDDTLQVTEQFARQVDFPVYYTTHAHTGFQLARCRNEGVVASTADYLLFLDGDCLIPPDHVECHLDRRRSGVVQAGYCCLLDEQTSRRLTVEQINDGQFCHEASREERRKLARMHRKARMYNWLGHRSKPKLYGGNVGIHRDDYQRVNGYDENFKGWGCEDDDLRLRLRSTGIRITSILSHTCTYHLWHPPGKTTPTDWREGNNVRYLLRERRRARCENGLSRYLSGEQKIDVRRWDDRRARSGSQEKQALVNRS